MAACKLRRFLPCLPPSLPASPPCWVAATLSMRETLPLISSKSSFVAPSTPLIRVSCRLRLASRTNQCIRRTGNKQRPAQLSALNWSTLHLVKSCLPPPADEITLDIQAGGVPLLRRGQQSHRSWMVHMAQFSLDCGPEEITRFDTINNGIKKSRTSQLLP